MLLLMMVAATAQVILMDIIPFMMVLSIAMLGHVLYYVVMIAVGLIFTTTRLRKLFLD